MLNSNQIINFKKNGYIVLPNFLDSNETKKLQNSVTEQREKKSKNEIYNSLEDENIWNFLCNKNLKNILNSLIGPKVYFLHDTDILDAPIIDKSSWHRDNPCRRTGVGPDWDNNEDYNVVSVAVYLCDSKETQTSLNVIPKSHILKYSSRLSNILRVMHLRSKNVKFLKPLRTIIQFVIGKEIHYKPGDLIIFLCNLYHKGSITNAQTQKANRQGLISRFGGSGNHYKTFMNYELNYRHAKERLLFSKKKEQYFEILKKNDLYVSPDIEKKEIKGIFISKDYSEDHIIKKQKDQKIL